MSAPCNSSPDCLPERLLNRVLEKLAIDRQTPSLESLFSLYRAWSAGVPFDNVRKLIHLRSGDDRPLPGGKAEDFLESWLSHGTGGTCWTGAGALHAVVTSLGFHAERGIATMLVHPHLPPNHGTVLVTLEGERWLLDTAMLSVEPLRIVTGEETSVAHPAWGARCSWRDGRCHVSWRPLHVPEGFECRIEGGGADAPDYLRRYEQTRGWSPFNYELNARVVRGDYVMGAAFGKVVTLHGDGRTTVQPATHEQRVRLLIDDVGMSEEIVSQLPEDIPTPPPPGSKTASGE